MPKRFNRTLPIVGQRSYRLWKIRREMGIGRPELGSWVDRSESTVQRWERGYSTIPDWCWAIILNHYISHLKREQAKAAGRRDVADT